MIVQKGCLDAFRPGTAEFVSEFGRVGEILCPAFFVGIVSRSGDPFPQEDVSNGLLPGQFLFCHQYGGTDCSHVCLWGIFLPVATCPNQETRDRLAELPDVVGDCARVELPAINRKLDELGPMHVEFGVNAVPVGEAFLAFSKNVDAIFDWLKKERFEYIVEIELGEGSAGRRITRTKPLEWQTVRDFEGWLSCLGRFPLKRAVSAYPEERNVIEPAHASVAFLYENSD